VYQDRRSAGLELAAALATRQFDNVVVLAVPRGGVFVAAPVARRLNARIDVLVTRKIGHPSNPEVAIGAVMPDGSAILDNNLIATFAISQDYIKRSIAEEYMELKRRMVMYSGKGGASGLQGCTAIIVDDGIATGYTVRAAVKWLKTQQPARIVVAVPVAPPDTVEELRREVDEVICPLQPEYFMSVGMYYIDFPQNTDAEVQAILEDLFSAEP
jgi:predicted phosphoribosyltransferase